MQPIPSEASPNPLQVERNLRNGKLVLARLRWKMAVSMLLSASLLTCGYEYLFYAEYLRRGMEVRCGRHWLAFAGVFFLSLLYFGPFLFLALAPLTDDLRVTRLVLLIDIVTVIISDVLIDTVFTEMGSPRFWSRVLSFTSCDIVLVSGFIRAMFCKAAPPMQKRMWDTLRIWLWVHIVVSTCSSIFWSLDCHAISNCFAWLPAKCLSLFLVTRPDLRQRCHKLLGNVFEKRCADRAAAGVAGLLGDCSVSDVLAQAASRFRSIHWSELCFEDVSDNAPDPALFAKSIHGYLHKCDAFVSHSWHDDAHAKWSAMQLWINEFIEFHGREPTAWLDKCCIDQSSIEFDLRCLPVFLSGCRHMVVFCGPTYLSRLWCIMEIFTFVHIGRGVDKIEFQLVLRKGYEDEDSAAIEDAFESFDARNCTCFNAADKERMLSIIHAAFGDMASFNHEVRSIFRRAKWQDAISRRCIASQSLRSNGSANGYLSDESDSSASSEREERSDDSDGQGSWFAAGCCLM